MIFFNIFSGFLWIHTRLFTPLHATVHRKWILKARTRMVNQLPMRGLNHLNKVDSRVTQWIKCLNRILQKCSAIFSFYFGGCSSLIPLPCDVIIIFRFAGWKKNQSKRFLNLKTSSLSGLNHPTPLKSYIIVNFVFFENISQFKTKYNFQEDNLNFPRSLSKRNIRSHANEIYE